MKKNPFILHHLIPETLFFGRQEHIKRFEENKERIINNREPYHLFFSGYFGIGKTSLVSHYAKILLKSGVYPIYFPAIEDRNVKDLLHALLTRLDTQDVSYDLRSQYGVRRPESSENIEFLKKINKILNSKKYSKKFKKMVEEDGVIPEYAFEEVLKNIWSDVNVIDKRLRGILLIFDDANYLYRLFERGTTWFRDTILRLNISDYRFILAGSFRPIGENLEKNLYMELRGYFRYSKIQEFSKDTTTEFYKEYLKGSHLKFDDELIDEIYKLTNGHPAMLQHVGHRLYNIAEGNNELNVDSIRENYSDVIEELKSFYERYSSCYINNENKRTIVEYIIKQKDRQGGVPKSDLSDNTSIKPNSLSPYLTELVDCGILKRVARGMYKVRYDIFVDLHKSIVEE